MRNDKLLKRLVAYGITRVEGLTNEFYVLSAVEGLTLFNRERGFTLI
jgi:hypothetical protein